MKTTLPAALGVLGVLMTGCSHKQYPEGRYLLSLASGSPGSPAIETAFDLERSGTAYRATILNGTERIEVPVVEREGYTLRLGFPHYDSALELTLTDQVDERTRAQGVWRVDRGTPGVAEVAVQAEPVSWGQGTRRPAIAVDRDAVRTVGGRWAMDFEVSGTGIGVFEVTLTGAASGTVLTPTGDYRYLAGRYEPTLRVWGPGDPVRDDDVVGTLSLSTFDGSHAFAIEGNMTRDGRMWGVFVSGNWWVEGWTARKDAGAALPDPFAQTTAVIQRLDADALARLVYTTPEGERAPLGSILPDGTPRVLSLFGTWCPNCADAAVLLKDLEAKYAPRGLRVAGLAFEADPTRAGERVRAYQQRHGIDWPVLIGGLKSKTEATKSAAFLDQVRAFPTTVFIAPDGTIKAVHTGFSGPATGAEHEAMRAKFEGIIEGILGIAG
jgi:thiol-disulfide isomerase/thioredoxin